MNSYTENPKCTWQYTQLARSQLTGSTVYVKHPMYQVGRWFRRQAKLGEHVRRRVGFFNLLNN